MRAEQSFEACPGVFVPECNTPGQNEILTSNALSFVADLVRAFRPAIFNSLSERSLRRSLRRAGSKLDFLPATKTIRESEWRCAQLPYDLLDRRVEITGPVDRKMIINALNSGASVFMADFEDSNSPTWSNVIEGQVHLRDAVRRAISYTAPDTGRVYSLVENPAVLFVRPRGLHLTESHVTVDGFPAPAALVDFGLYFFHNAHALISRGTGPYFYLPKLESHLEARIWNDVFIHAQSALGLQIGTIKATCLIETLPAAFEMDEILFELRDHSAGLNCGRWDYIFSYIKENFHNPSAVLPDRGQVTMTQPFMRAYTRLVVRTCHRRGVPAIGGMAAQIPIKHDAAKNESALAKVRADKLREVEDGHDGTWVAHPGLVSIAREIFDSHMTSANQIDSDKQRDHIALSEHLLEAPEGTRTAEGLRQNVRVCIRYIEAWLRGTGCVPLYDMMEDAATAEISRTQIWQWVKHKSTLEDGTVVTPELVSHILDDEMLLISDLRCEGNRYDDARSIFLNTAIGTSLVDFLTLPAYEKLLA